MHHLIHLPPLSFVLIQALAVYGQSSYTTTAPAPWSSAWSSDSAPSSTSSREPITRTVAVAKGGHTFVPNVIQAEVGDSIEFRFYPRVHSVVRAAYNYPCIPFELIETDKVGFSSGLRPVDAILDDPPTWTLQINETDPIFFYCSAPGSCINYGMVGVINPNATTSLEVQQDAAEKSKYMLQPGENFPDETKPPNNSGADYPEYSSSSTASSSGVPTATATPAAVAGTRSSGLSTGAIAGITIGASAVLLMAAALIYLCGRNRALSDIIYPHQNQRRPNDFEDKDSQYLQAGKHMSGMTMIDPRPESGVYAHAPPTGALPGYAGPHDGAQSHPRTQYTPYRSSDVQNVANPAAQTPPTGLTGIPAHIHSSPGSPQTPLKHLGEGPHEMDTNARRYYQSTGLFESSKRYG